MKMKSFYRAVKIATIACAALAMLILLGQRLLLWWAGHMLGCTVRWSGADGAGLIGIIGGADGPTAIFTTMRITPPLLWAGVLTALSVVGCVSLFLPRKRDNK